MRRWLGGRGPRTVGCGRERAGAEEESYVAILYCVCDCVWMGKVRRNYYVLSRWVLVGLEIGSGCKGMVVYIELIVLD